MRYDSSWLRDGPKWWQRVIRHSGAYTEDPNEWEYWLRIYEAKSKYHPDNLVYLWSVAVWQGIGVPQQLIAQGKEVSLVQAKIETVKVYVEHWKANSKEVDE